MKRSLPLLAACAISSTVFAGKPTQPPPTIYSLQSASVRLDVGANGSYNLVELASGKVLLSQNQTSLTVGNQTLTSSGISNVVIAGNTLQGTLTLTKGNTANVRFTFANPDALQVELFRPTNVAQPTAVSQRFTDTGARYYGVWEAGYANALDNRGVNQAFDGKEPTGTVVKDVFAASARAPFYMTGDKVGVYVQSTARGSYAFAQSGNTSFSFDGPSMKYHLLYGSNYKAVLNKYNQAQYGGSAFMPPDWAFSTIWWRDDGHLLPAKSAARNARELYLEDAAKLRQYKIPAAAMWLDRPYGTDTNSSTSNVAGWGNMDFDASYASAHALVQQLSGQGIRTMLWNANKANNNLKTYAPAGTLFNVSNAAPGFDMSKQAAVDYFTDQLNVLLSNALLADGTTGIKGYKIDRSGEGEIPDALINQQVTLFQKMAAAQMASRNGSDYFNFTRNINDTGRQYAAVWSGDPRTSWLGLQTSVKNGLRTGLVNMPMWGSDTGGYSGGGPVAKELLARWMGFSAYSPMMEIEQGPSRTIWFDYDQQTIDLTTKHTQTHHDLIPYTRSAMFQAIQTGTPIMRPMFLEFQGDGNVADMWDQYMYGPNILVAPVTTSGATSRSVYLPQGKWMNYEDRRTVYAGGRSYTVAAPLDVIPTFVREGAIVPRGDIVQGNNNWTSGTWTPSLRVEMFPSKAMASSFDYYTGGTNGAPLVSTITTTPSGDDIVIAFGDLGLSGELDVYVKSLQGVMYNGQVLGTDQYTFDPSTFLLELNYLAGISSEFRLMGVSDIWGNNALTSMTLASSFNAAMTLSAVPEPAALGVAGFGALLMGRRRRTPAHG
jgi:alpha-glucosidase (family GH31 glycosyl hydrolase)